MEEQIKSTRLKLVIDITRLSPAFSGTNQISLIPTETKIGSSIVLDSVGISLTARRFVETPAGDKNVSKDKSFIYPQTDSPAGNCFCLQLLLARDFRDMMGYKCGWLKNESV